MTTGERQPLGLVWDSSALLHACRTDRADVLLDLATASCSGPHATTATVVEELTLYQQRLPNGIDVVALDDLEVLIGLARWVQRLGAGRYNRGEATVCAWAQVHRAIVIMDDRAAAAAARREGLEVHGTAWLCGRAVRAGRIDLLSASNLLNGLIADGARYPFPPGGFGDWAKGVGLLP